MSTEFFITSLIVVLLPGTGVIYTISVGLLSGWRASVWAAAGCTIGIVPHLVASILGLAALLHMSSLAFQTIKFAGAAYLLYIAWTMWRETGGLNLQRKQGNQQYHQIAIKGVLINILNPKLSLFFLAFLPQFISPTEPSMPQMVLLGGVFMTLSLVLFILYGVFANAVRHYVIESPVTVRNTQRGFAVAFAALGLKLATAER